MSNFGKNIKKIRSLKKLSQTAFAELFNITRASVSAYEDGRSEPKSSKVLEIAKYFNININDLLDKELTVNMLMNFSLPEEEDNSKATSTKRPALAFNQVPFITADQQSEYIEYCLNPKPTKHFPLIHYPIKDEGDFCVLEHNNDAMRLETIGIFCGDLLFSKKIELKKAIINPKNIYTIVSSQGIFTGRITLKTNILEINFDNPAFSPQSIDSKAIIEIREVQAVFSTQFNNTLNINQRLEQLETFLKK